MLQIEIGINQLDINSIYSTRRHLLFGTFLQDTENV
jgi:hypothetical protein